MTVGERIKELRKEAKLTLDDISKATGIPKSTIQRWESGAIRNMGHAGLKKVAEALGTSVNYLQTGVSVTVAKEEKPRQDDELVFDYLAEKCGYRRNHVPEDGNLYYVRREDVVRTDGETIRNMVEAAASYMGYLLHQKSFSLSEFLEYLNSRAMENKNDRP